MSSLTSSFLGRRFISITKLIHSDRGLCYCYKGNPITINYTNNHVKSRKLSSLGNLSGNSKCKVEFNFNQWSTYAVTYFSSMSTTDVRCTVESISDKFTEAVELLNDAKSSMGTIYFTDDMKDAETVVNEILSDYKALLSKLDDQQKTEVQRTIGLKMEELQAHLQIVKDASLKD